MATLFRRKGSANWYYRRRVPRALQSVLGKTEIHKSCGTAILADAKRKQPGIADEVQRLFDAAGRTVTLTDRDVHALAAEWLKRRLAAAEQVVPDADDADQELDGLERIEAAGRHETHMADEADALLRAEGLPAVDERSRRALTERLFWREVEFWQVRARQAHGDYSPAKSLAKAPEWRAPAVAPGSVSLDDIFKLWKNAPATPRSRKTVYTRQRQWEALTKFLDTKDARRVGVEDAWRWVDFLKAQGLDAVTINTGYLDGARAVFSVAKKRRLRADNPFAEVSVPVDAVAKRKTKRQAFTDDEARSFLTKARVDPRPAVRWLPFVLAYTGARLDEVAGARAADVREEHGVRLLEVRLEGRSEDERVKTTTSFRSVPLHSALLAEGFWDYARGLDQSGALFPDLSPDLFGRRSGTATKKLGRFLRKVVKITDPRKVAAYSWRHRFISLTRAFDLDRDARRYLAGHGNEDDHSEYGGWALQKTRREIEKLPDQLAEVPTG